MNQIQCDAIKMAIRCMRSEIDLLDQAERMNLGNNTPIINSLSDAVLVLQRMIDIYEIS